MINFACICGSQFLVPNDLAGKRARCPSCGMAIAVPVPFGLTIDELGRNPSRNQGPPFTTAKPVRVVDPEPARSVSAPAGIGPG